MKNKIIISVVSSLAVATIAAAAKSYIDVERLKVQNKSTKEIVIDMRIEQKEMRRDIKDILRRLP